MTRRRLPNRRRAVNFSFALDRVNYEARVGFYPDGVPGEMFLSAGKVGSGVNVAARDAAIATSLALQYGCPVAELLDALTKSPGGPKGELVPDGPLGVALREVLDMAKGRER